MNTKKFTILEKSLFWLNSKKFALSSIGPNTFGLIFRNGDKYFVEGDRIDGTRFSFFIANIKFLGVSTQSRAYEYEEIGEIIKKELEMRGMTVTVYETK
jgi:hypothetical protein